MAGFLRTRRAHGLCAALVLAALAALPMASDRLTAECYPRFGFAGAKAQLLAQVREQFLAAAGRTTQRTADPHAPAAQRFVLFEESIEAQRILDLRRGQSEQFGDFHHGLQRHVAQPFADQVQRRQRDGLPRGITSEATLDLLSQLRVEYLHRSSFSYRSNSAAMIFKLPSTATTSLSVWPRIRCGNSAKLRNDGGRQRAR